MIMHIVHGTRNKQNIPVSANQATEEMDSLVKRMYWDVKNFRIVGKMLNVLTMQKLEVTDATVRRYTHIRIRIN
jgi:Mg2+/Co2+ transporter CorB